MSTEYLYCNIGRCRDNVLDCLYSTFKSVLSSSAQWREITHAEHHEKVVSDSPEISGKPEEVTPGTEHDHELARKVTLAVDVENRDAVKGDDSDGQIEWTIQSIIATICLAGLYVGSQIPLYFVGGSLSFIAADLGGASKITWLPVSNTLAIAAFAPFCGYMQDIFGRRNITILGAVMIMVGIVVVGTAHKFGVAVVGMSLAGGGAAIGELTALAGTAELVPVNKRGAYLAMVTVFVIPFVPYVLYSQLLGTYHTWRWGMWVCLIYNGVFFVGVLFTYFPHSRSRAEGISKMDVFKKIDFLGGFLSIVGLTLFLVALQAGGYSHPWGSAYVMCTLLIGLSLIVAFIAWEWKFAKYPIVPRELFTGQRIIPMAYFIAFVAGMNFFSLLNFFPLEFTELFPPDPVQIGLKGLGPGLSTTIGATLVNALLSIWKGHNRELLLFSTVIMTTFGGALAAVTPDTPKLLVALGTMCGFGVGGVLVPAATIAITVSPDALIATCVALSLSIRVIGGSIGYTIYYNVFYNKLVKKLPAYIGLAAVTAGLPIADAEKFVLVFLGAPSDIAAVPGVTPKIIEAAVVAVRWAYADSLKYVWLISISFGVCAIVACAFLGNIQKYMTNRIAARIAH